MKYFTKDWYNRMQSTGMHMLIRIDERCNEFSEKLFSELYTKEKEQYLKIMSFCDDFNEFCKIMKNVDDNFINLDEEEKNARFLEFRQEELGGKSLSDKFDEKINYSLVGIKEKLNSDLLNEVADIRLLALGYASKEIYKQIEKISNENEKFVNEKVKEYADYLKDNFSEGHAFLDEYFHDGYIVSTEVSGSDFVINFESENHELKKLIFKDYEIIVDEGIIGNDWLYHEIYRSNDGGLEISILTGFNDLKEFAIRCSEVIVQ